jgi:hypothetical protein
MKHRCDVPDLDYSCADPALGEDQTITCRTCKRVWRLNIQRNEFKGITYTTWWPYPCPKCDINPKACVHYGRRPTKKKKTI